MGPYSFPTIAFSLPLPPQTRHTLIFNMINEEDIPMTSKNHEESGPSCTNCTYHVKDKWASLEN